MVKNIILILLLLPFLLSNYVSQHRTALLQSSCYFFSNPERSQNEIRRCEYEEHRLIGPLDTQSHSIVFPDHEDAQRFCDKLGKVRSFVPC